MFSYTRENKTICRWHGPTAIMYVHIAIMYPIHWKSHCKTIVNCVFFKVSTPQEYSTVWLYYCGLPVLLSDGIYCKSRSSPFCGTFIETTRYKHNVIQIYLHDRAYLILGQLVREIGGNEKPSFPRHVRAAGKTITGRVDTSITII